MCDVRELMPHERRWDEVTDLVGRILSYRVKDKDGTANPVVLFPWVAGGGFELGAVIGAIPGSSSTLLGFSVLGDQAWSHRPLSFETDRSCTAEVGDGLAVSNFLEIQRTKGADFNPKRIIGVAVTATIATTDPNAGIRGGQRAYISIRTNEGLKRIALRFRHSSEYPGTQRDKRKFQSQVIDLAVLNLIGNALGVGQILLLPEYGVTLEEGTLTRAQVHGTTGDLILPVDVFPSELATRIRNEETLTLVHHDGTILPADTLVPGQHELIPCSANPFTPAHDEMALHVAARGRKPVFVINTENAEKGEVGVEDLVQRVRAFIGRWPVAICRGMPRFVEMAEAFGCDFTIGGDTARRIFHPRYCDWCGGSMNVYTRLKAAGVRFTVYPRANEHGRMWTAADVASFAQDIFTDANGFLSPFSSTAVRRALSG